MKSMTGFGNAKLSRNGIDLEVEIKSVNSRYLDQRLYLPRELMFYEEKIRALLPRFVSRGTVELRISYTDHREPKLSLDNSKLIKYNEMAIAAAQLLGQNEEVSLEFLLQEPGVIESCNSLSEDPQLLEILDESMEKALQKLVLSLSAEARGIRQTLLGSMQVIEDTLTEVEKQCLPYKEELYQKMLKRVEELVGSYKLENLEQRLVQEIAIYVDKYDIGEEISRINTHIDTFRESLESETDNGKTLNFIIQEMQREANTLGSKFSTSGSFKLILRIKEEVEKCREIVQNVA